MVLKMNMLAINKHSVKLKNLCFKMPNAPYFNRRYGQGEETTVNNGQINKKEVLL